MWFEQLTGFVEESPRQVREHLNVDGEVLTSRVNGKSWKCGRLETPTLGELRERVQASSHEAGTIAVREVVADVRNLHADPSNAGALFQVASQFNLLEMRGPDVTPEEGVDIYEDDHTQGPACAVAAGAGTIYRNYFAVVNGQVGQSAGNQIDCLADIGAALGNAGNRLWRMTNGYAMASQARLMGIAERLQASDESAIDGLRRLLRIGIQWNPQVTLRDAGHTVSQAYCSALPVTYSGHAGYLWEPFARLVLEAAYEATLCAAVLNAARTGMNRVFLTLVGGGAFGNEADWIIAAVRRALSLYRHADLDVAIVSYGQSNRDVRQLVGQ